MEGSCRVFLIFVLLGPLAVFAHSYEECPEIDRICPKNMQEFKREITCKVFDDIPIEDYDGDTEEIIEELRCLSESSNPHHSGISYVVASWLSVYMPRMDELPSFCCRAQLINASLSEDPDQLRTALNATEHLVHVFSLQRQYNAIAASGCEVPPIITQNEHASCWENGFAYEIDAMWKKRGHVLPSNLRPLVRRLYDSKLQLNRLIALIITYSISEPASVVIDKFPFQESLQATWLQYSCRIPKHCCAGRLATIQSFHDEATSVVCKTLDSLKPPCICPSLNVSSKDYRSLLRNTTNIVLSKPPPNLSKAGRAVRDELKKMLNSGNQKYAQIASSTLIMYQTYADNIKIAPSFCAYAKFINETVVYADDERRAKMANAVDGLAKFTPYLIYLFHKDSVSASMCESAPVPKPAIAPPSGCYKDGFAYDIDGLWCLKEDCVPCTLPEKVKCLYNSKNQLDKILANILTYVVSDPLLDYYLEQNITYKNIKAKYSSKIQKCCCEDRLKELNEIEAQSLNALAKAIEKAKKSYCSK